MYDLIKYVKFPKEVKNIFDDVDNTFTTTPIGSTGCYKDKPFVNATANELSSSIVTHLVKRCPEVEEFHLEPVPRQWNRFFASGSINIRKVITEMSSVFGNGKKAWIEYGHVSCFRSHGPSLADRPILLIGLLR